MIRLLIALLLSLVSLSAFAQTGPTPSYNSLTTGGINNVIYIAPYSAQNPTGVRTDCSADAQPTIQAVISNVYLRSVPRATIVLPAGCIGLGSELTLTGNGFSGPYSWTQADNRVIDIVGAGRDVTILRVLNSTTNLLHKDANYSVNGSFRNMTLDGNGLATNVLNVEQSSQMHFSDMIIQNAAAGGVCFLAGPGPGSSATFTPAAQSYVENLEINCPTSASAFPSIWPSYAVYASTTDWHWTNITATGAAISDFATSAISGGNRYINIHAWNYFGNGSGAQLYSSYPSYCFQISEYLSHWVNSSCDGAKIAATQVNSWNNTFESGHAQWSPGQTDSAPTYAAAVYTAAISGNVLTVSNVAVGTLAVGQTISGVNVTGAPTIQSLGSGTGGTGTYNLSTSQTSASSTMASNSAVGFQLANGVGNEIITTQTMIGILPPQGAVALGTQGPNNIIQLNQGISNNEGLVAGSSLLLSGDATVPSFWTVKSNNGNMAAYYAPAYAVNYPTSNANISGSDVTFGSLGGDTNRNIQIVPNGTGIVKLLGAGTNVVGTNGSISLIGPQSANGNGTIGLSGSTGIVAFSSPVSLLNNSTLGVPTSLTLTNATGLPVSTGLSGTGTGVVTALGTSVNGTGAIVLASNLPLSGTSSSIGGSALTIGTCSSANVTVTGATTAMAVEASPVTYPGDAIYWKGYVSSANTVTIKVCAVASVTPTASSYNVRVIQ